MSQKNRIILTLDGGGIRGAATAQFLSRIERQLNQQHNLSIRDCVDFYAGTSTGSIIALALATTDLSVDAINKLYNASNAKKIFAENKGLFEFDGVNAPKYEANGKTKLLKENFGNAKLSDVAPDKHVLAVSYAIEIRKPEVIKSTDPDHVKLLAYKVADASSAAPTYFPSRKIAFGSNKPTRWLVDGGVTANNPTMCAIAEAIEVWKQPIDQLRVLSIGTGYRRRKINGPESQKWGAVQWFSKGHILDVLTDEHVVNYQARTIMPPGTFIRVNADLTNQSELPDPPDDAMDDIDEANIKKLKKMGDFWYKKYGEHVVNLLLDKYQGPTLDCIDTESGQPKEK
ncbi:MAG: patatin-like phospholipase family protein [Pseudomonadota bacterium]